MILRDDFGFAAQSGQEADDNIVPFPAQPSDPVQVRDQIAKEAGVSAKTASDFMTIMQKGTKEDVEAVVSGNASISGKAKEVCAREWSSKMIR
jgi:hypothetical protein